MLELDNEQSLVDLAWDEVETRLPDDMDDFFEQMGLAPHRPSCRRAYQRFFIRGKAILRWQEKYLGVYSADASRQGLRFLSPIELALTERGRIRLPNTKEFQIEIIRCQRIAEACYDCGAMFVLAKPAT